MKYEVYEIKEMKSMNSCCQGEGRINDISSSYGPFPFQIR